MDAIKDSLNLFEKNLVYLSAGSLALSIGFVENRTSGIPPICNWLIILSWLLLATALLLNLASHLISAANSGATLDGLDSGDSEQDLYLEVTRRNKKMRRINWCTFILFGLGILFSVVYCSLNLK